MVRHSTDLVLEIYKTKEALRYLEYKHIMQDL
jgi:hypothetical protein